MNAPGQCLEALRLGNEVRTKRAHTRAALQELPTYQARAQAAAIILDPEPHLVGMRVGVLVEACRQMGPARMAAMLKPLRILPGTRICDLSGFARECLAEVLSHDGERMRRAA